MTNLKHTFLTFIFFLSLNFAHAQSIDKTIVIVNEEVLTQNEWDKEFNQISSDFKQRGKSLPDNSSIRQQVLEKLIIRSILLQQAKRKNIVISERQVQAAFRKVAASNKLSTDQFRKALIRQGINYSQFYQKIRDELTIRRLQSRETNKLVNISEQEIQSALVQAGLSDNQEYYTAHILLPVPEAATPEQVSEQLEKINALKLQLNDGINFNTLAQQFSSGENALEGGELGWRKRHELPTLFADSVNSLKAGDYSEVLRSPSGFHILHLIKQRTSNLEEIKQTQARHILIKTDAIQSKKDVIDKLNSLRDRIIQGEDFAEIAKSNSIDYMTANQGGDLGWLAKGETVPEFEDTMNSMKINKVSYPFKSQFGWHILEVTGYRTVNSTESSQEANIKQQLLKRKKQEALELWQKRLRDQAYVKFI